LRALLSVLLLAGTLACAVPARAQDVCPRAGQVTITRDDHGIAHVRGATDADAVLGMIYAQAEDDFPRIETNYLVSLGRLAEAQGPSALWQDLRQRLFIDPEELRGLYAGSPAWLKRLMDAWAAGLNCYLAHHPETHPQVLTHFEPWMALSFTEGSIGGDIERVVLPALRSFYDGVPAAASTTEPVWREPSGSNGIAIAPDHTASGHALLLINPHTSFFFRSELQMQSAAGLDAYGAVTWGQIFIYQGFNEHAGWMHTSSGVDSVDEFSEDIRKGPDGVVRYRYGSRWRRVRTGHVELAYRTAEGGLARRSFTTYATHHGPIVRAAANGRWIAMALMNRPVPALEQSFLRTKTHDYKSFLEVAQLHANSSNNTIFADSAGEIAYLHPQFVPRRSDRFDYTQTVDGADPATDWQGLHDLATLPHVVSPSNGWVMNTNNAPWTAAGADSPRAADYPRYMDTAGENPRGPHAERVLGTRRDFTLESLVAAAYDSYLTAFARLLPPLLAAHEHLPADDPLRTPLAAPIALLRDWDLRWSPTSTQTSLAVFWGEALWARCAKQAEAAHLSTWDYMATRASDGDRLTALREAVGNLTRDFGGWQVPWGDINRFQRNDGAITQTFDDARSSIPVPFTSSRWGSLASFGAHSYPGTKRWYGTSGNSFVAAVEFGPRIRAVAVTAGGESGHPQSPHFLDQAQAYADGHLRPVYFYPEDLAGHIERTYHPGEVEGATPSGTASGAR
jgi:acyl-homoserine-lactone acylase